MTSYNELKELYRARLEELKTALPGSSFYADLTHKVSELNQQISIIEEAIEEHSQKQTAPSIDEAIRLECLKIAAGIHGDICNEKRIVQFADYYFTYIKTGEQ